MTRYVSFCVKYLEFWANFGQGGHFAAFELPEVFWQDVEDFVTAVKAKVEF